jgi:hypothetical protein
MIKEVYAPSDYTSINQDPSIPIEKKLEIISNARPVVIAYKWINTFKITLPFVQGATSEFFKEDPNLARDPNLLLLHDLNVGDKELYLKGIGTRLLQATVRHGELLNPNLEGIRAVDAHLGLVNTFVKCFGEDNTAIFLSPHDHYGKGSDKPLKAIFDHQPPIEGEPYKVWEVQAQVDPEQVKSWELPIINNPK